MEWYRELYDDFRQRTGFGGLAPERTRRDVDFILDVCALTPGDKVLDLCAGTGRHSIELALRGVRVVAVELNEGYVELAQRRAAAASVRPTFVLGDVRGVSFDDDFDAAILMWNSFGYFSDDENRTLLAKTRAALKPGARFVLEVLNRDFLLAHFEARSETTISGVWVVEERYFDHQTNRMRSFITRHHDAHREQRRTDWRLYSLHELKSLGEDVGLDLVASYGDLAKTPADNDTRLLRLVYSRPSH